MVGAGVGNDAVPDDGRVCAVVASAARPVGSDVDKEVLGVPGEEAGEVGFEREANDGVFFLFGAVVVRAAFDSVCTCFCQPAADRFGVCAVNCLLTLGDCLG